MTDEPPSSRGGVDRFRGNLEESLGLQENGLERWLCAEGRRQMVDFREFTKHLYHPWQPVDGSVFGSVFPVALISVGVVLTEISGFRQAFST